MKRIALAAVVVALGLTALYWPSGQPEDEILYSSQAIDSGDIRKVIAATGTLAAVDDVVVGAQLSGQIDQVLVDFNDPVEAGQLLAKIDPRTFQARVDQYQAQVDKMAADLALQQVAIERAQVNAELAQRDLERAQALKGQQHISEEELDRLATAAQLSVLEHQQAQLQLGALEATLAQNLATLAQGQIELDRTDIRAPIDGFVINRTIEPGQTVAASLNTPELFVLARDLAEMEIEAFIDESDIGQVAEGQRVSFDVDAYPDRRFQGEVSQIRKAPQNNSGVVSYTVIISANNREGILLPGMTANLELQVDNLRQVARIPNAAVRLGQREAGSNDSGNARMGSLEALNLTDEQREQLRAARPARDAGASMGPGGDRNREQMRQRMDQLMDRILTDEQKVLKAQLDSGAVRAGHLLVLEQGEPTLIPVQLGLSDGEHTALLSPELEGREVITQMRSRL
ncbi:efflux RND transporter periplasmic adaptor subunit [Ferrimonas marina]|uniref:HlyD family secretion protein n=1 Tax=Ferrimonas marina TaxID=299255 RepID=A0A1M5XB10_9GAMM|nr:efflux RND transporter periplasmic adaptor subunit [Ferrimonas marina]SHH97001.1 HlyD family secretion protein [Ferrimonas marina]